MTFRSKYIKGISLIEGLVAVVVLAIGLLAVFSFQVDVLRSGVDAKTRTEAMQVAGARLGELRDMATRFDTYGSQANFLTALQAEAGNAAWPNATDRRFWVSTCVDGTAAHPLVHVRVSWTNSTVACNNATPSADQLNQLVDASAEIGLKNLASGVILNETKPAGGAIRAPTGEAEYGRGRTNIAGLNYGTDLNNPNAGTGRIMKDNRATDGTLVVHATDGTYQLLNSAGEILIQSPTPLGTISGNVFVPASMSIERDYIKVGAPDVSWCITMPVEQLVNQSGNLVFDALPYNCYFGAGWYGAIGPLLYEPDPTYTFDPGDPNPTLIRSEFGTNDRVCLGEDGIADSGASTSRHPQLSFIRTYRGYTRLTDANGVPLVDANNKELFASSGIAHEKDASGYTRLFSVTDHDFLLARITGQAADSDCSSRLAAGNAIVLDGVAMTDFFGSGLNPPADGNPGKFYCLTTMTSGCPSPLPTNTGQPVTSRSITIATQLFLDGSTNPQVINGATVTLNGATTCSPSGSSYFCTVTVVEGGTWAGYVVVALPSGYQVAAGGSSRVDLSNVTANQTVSFNVSTVTQLPRTIRGSVAFAGNVTSFGGLGSSPVGNCQATPSGTNYGAGPFSCSYGNLGADTSVALTVVTAQQNHVLCGGTNKQIIVPAPGTGDISGVKLCIAQNQGKCGQCPP